jgi:hypothetical protein
MRVGVVNSCYFLTFLFAWLIDGKSSSVTNGTHLKKTEWCLSKKCIGLVLFDGNMSAIEYRRLFKIRLSFVRINFISCSFRQTVCWDWESMTIKLIGFYLISYIPCLWFRDKSQYSTIGFGYVSHEWHVFSIFCYMWIICTIIILLTITGQISYVILTNEPKPMLAEQIVCFLCIRSRQLRTWISLHIQDR